MSASGAPIPATCGHGRAMTPPKKPPRRPTGVLTAKTEPSAPILTADELVFIKAFRTMDARGRNGILTHALYQATEWPERRLPILRLIGGVEA
jgi:hypothetical protein